MAYLEISHDEHERAKAILGTICERTGALRWWRPIGGEPILQGEWINGAGSRIWINIPTLAEFEKLYD